MRFWPPKTRHGVQFGANDERSEGELDSEISKNVKCGQHHEVFCAMGDGLNVEDTEDE